MSLQIGYAAENSARSYLLTQGLTWIRSNFRCRLGEIDLIMKDNTHLVFIEVRTRASSSYGGAIESITASKKKKILKTASFYLLTNKIYDKYPVRFDVLCIDAKPAQVEWIKNAFGVDY